MLIGFVGDVHGQVFHALAAVVLWQHEAGRQLDVLFQVGDLGAYPDLARMDAASQRYLAADPSQADFSRFLRMEGAQAAQLHRLRQSLASPIYFIRGNHDDDAWLCALPRDSATGTAPVDPFDVFHYVPDGTVLQFGGLRIACLGGIESPEEGEAAEAAIDHAAYHALLTLDPGTTNVLITHDAPYGVSVGYRGQIQGSLMITHLIEHIQPVYHVAGHLALLGPHVYGATTSLVLGGLVASTLWDPGAHGLEPGCLAVLDTDAAHLWPVTEPWLARFPSPFDADALLARCAASQGPMT
jgi:Icc-related predicted phosphoesterase